ncbi:MAG: hypothetical protein IPO22_08965 [Anaerolineales bacterium]|nr:hypothetical protein [Anaerolineales bacterium]
MSAPFTATRNNYGYFAHWLRCVRLPDDLPGQFKEQILPERLASISLSFLVDGMSKQRGGIAPNIAYTMALLGQTPRVMATVGEDFGDYRAWLDSKGVDTSLMKVVWHFTASFFATTDLDSAQIASFYPGAMAYQQPVHQGVAETKPDLVIVSPSAPDAMMKFPAECRELGIKYLYDPSQQVLRLEGLNWRGIWKGRASSSAMITSSV